MTFTPLPTTDPPAEASAPDAKDETIDELRRRAEAAERERDELQQQPPLPIESTAGEVKRRPWWRRLFS
jgi:hypothetical protein